MFSVHNLTEVSLSVNQFGADIMIRFDVIAKVNLIWGSYMRMDESKEEIVMLMYPMRCGNKYVKSNNSSLFHVSFTDLIQSNYVQKIQVDIRINYEFYPRDMNTKCILSSS